MAPELAEGAAMQGAATQLGQTLQAVNGTVCETPAEVLGMKVDAEIGVQERLPQLRMRPHTEGTVVIVLSPDCVDTLSTFPLGSVFALGPAGSLDIFDRVKMPAMVMRAETLPPGRASTSIIELLTVSPPTIEGGIPKWGVYDVRDKRRSEYDDAVDFLLLHHRPDEGNEPVSVLTSVRNALIRPSHTDTRQLTAVGHTSHEKPTIQQSVRNSMLQGAFHIQEIKIVNGTVIVGEKPSETRWLVQARLGQNDTVTPLVSYGEVSHTDSRFLYTGALDHAARRIARTNPTGLGKGTPVEKVRDAFLETAVNLGEVVANGGTVRHGANLFRSNMGLNPQKK